MKMALVDGSLTAEEAIKQSSDYLRGDLASDIENAEPNVAGSSEHLLKFHGIYAQDHRDVRRQRSLAGEALEYIFMVRVAIPGGKLSTEQWLALDTIASDLADGTIRLTTRQAVQFHGVVKNGLRPLAFALDAHLMTHLPAAKIQDRHRQCPRELRGRSRPGPRSHSCDPRRPRRRIQRRGRRRIGSLVRAARHLRATG